MTEDKIAVLLQVIGFPLASVSIALRLGFVKSVADRLKGLVERLAERQTVSSSALVDAIILASLAVLWTSIPQTLKRPPGMKKRLYGARLLQYLGILLLSTILVAYIRVSRTTRRVADGLAGPDVVTNLSIGCGTLLMFVGLLLEFLSIK